MESKDEFVFVYFFFHPIPLLFITNIACDLSKATKRILFCFEKIVLNMFYKLNLLFITFNILAPTNDISFITTSCNCSYLYVSLFNEFVEKFSKVNKDCWKSMFNVECIVKPLILKAILLINAISKALVFVKTKYMSLL
jgi:hypothetical protein